VLHSGNLRIDFKAINFCGRTRWLFRFRISSREITGQENVETTSAESYEVFNLFYIHMFFHKYFLISVHMHETIFREIKIINIHKYKIVMVPANNVTVSSVCFRFPAGANIILLSSISGLALGTTQYHI
jgi:hypothetical protein